MKLTATQLKKIIAEEVQKAHKLQEANPMMMSPRYPARDKVRLSVTFFASGDKIMANWKDSMYVEENEGSLDDLLDYVHTELEVD
jgi:hypothetical protein